MSLYRATETAERSLWLSHYKAIESWSLLFSHNILLMCFLRCLIWENHIRFIKAPYLFNSCYSCGHFVNPEKIFQVFIWLSKMQSLILNKPMPFKGTCEATFGSILRNNKVNIPTGTNWLNSLVNIDFKMYNIWELNITHPFFRFVFLQPGQHCPKMWIEHIEVEMREKKYMYFTWG